MTQTNNIKTTEHGRSMTEMLGVLAIIGTLSISGIAGYTYAMNKHRANEIISSVSKMAMTATTEIDLHGNPSLVEFKKGGKIMTDNGYEVVLEDDPNNGIFRLKVQNVPEAVCDKIINADFKLAFNVSPCASGDNEVTFLFYDSLNNNVDDTPISDTDSGNTDSPSSGAVSSATQTQTTTPLSTGGNNPPYCATHECIAYYDEYISWTAARDKCGGIEHMVTLADVGCTLGGCPNIPTYLRKKGMAEGFWVADCKGEICTNSSDNSGYAYVVDTADIMVSYASRFGAGPNGGFRAVCK